MPSTTPDPASTISARPFLKWVGGKGQLLPELAKRVALARPYNRYHEPFFGGGALFFWLKANRALGKGQAHLTDNNPNLLEAYIGVRDHVEEVIRLLEAHKLAHCEAHYYAVRANVPFLLPDRAARIIYLNRTCFNGLYRENSRGEFNVPMGRYKNPLICDADNLRAVSAALKRAKLAQRPFREVLHHAVAGDFVYFDPPYWPLSDTSSFTAYAKDNFGRADQEELADVYRQLAERGVRVLLSNSDTPLIHELYAGFTIETVQATRNVNSKADARGKISELLVRNF